jgi:hypothetical protein
MFTPNERNEMFEAGDKVEVSKSYEGGREISYYGTVASVKPSGTILIHDATEVDGAGTPILHYCSRASKITLLTKGDVRMTEDWLIQNLPAGWAYDCSMRNPRGMGFIVGPKETLYEEGGALFIPLSLLK